MPYALHTWQPQEGKESRKAAPAAWPYISKSALLLETARPLRGVDEWATSRYLEKMRPKIQTGLRALQCGYQYGWLLTHVAKKYYW
jgi:hypothetical protein